METKRSDVQTRCIETSKCHLQTAWSFQTNSKLNAAREKEEDEVSPPSLKRKNPSHVNVRCKFLETKFGELVLGCIEFASLVFGCKACSAGRPGRVRDAQEPPRQVRREPVHNTAVQLRHELGIQRPEHTTIGDFFQAFLHCY